MLRIMLLLLHMALLTRQAFIILIANCMSDDVYVFSRKDKDAVVTATQELVERRLLLRYYYYYY